MPKTVDEYIDAHPEWREGLCRMRDLAIQAGFTETVKWGAPCYTHNGRNVVGLAAFKAYFGLWFFDGASIDDVHGVLINAQSGKTRNMRQWRLTSEDEISPEHISAYLVAAKAVAENPPAPAPRPANTSPTDLPSPLAEALAEDEALAKAFSNLTPGRQREYAAHIGEAKQAATRERRLGKVTHLILAGKGLNDAYR